MKLIIDLITSSVAPGHGGCWTTRGNHVTPPGPDDAKASGSITPFYLSLSLIVRHTPEVHDQVANRLRQLRRLKELQDPTRGAVTKVEGAVPSPTEALAGAVGSGSLSLALTVPSQQFAGAAGRFEVTVGNPSNTPARNVAWVVTVLPVTPASFIFPHVLVLTPGRGGSPGPSPNSARARRPRSPSRRQAT